MKIEFFWTTNSPVKQPYPKTNIKNHEGVDLLACFLMDDGGCGCEDAVEDIDDGLYELGLFMSGKEKDFDWARHSWGAKKENKDIKIYSLYDEEYFVTMNIGDFNEAVKSWRDFILKG